MREGVAGLLRDRSTRKLGIPFIKIGEGKRGLVRYDLADLDAWVEGRKRRALPQVPPPQSIARPAPVAEPEPRTCPHGLGPSCSGGVGGWDHRLREPRSEDRKAAAQRRIEELLVLRSNQMIHSLRERPRPAAASRGSAVNHVFDPEH